MNDDEYAPTTGVYSGGDLAWENMPDDGIDLDYEMAREEAEEAARVEVLGAGDFPELDADEVEAAVAEIVENEMMLYESSGGTVLYGDWVQDDDGLYGPDSENQNAEFSMIYNSNENTAQVVWSRFVRYGRPASPCYPGQVDAQPDDPTEPEGAVAAAVPVEQVFCTAPRRCCVPYYALPEYALRGDE